MNSRLPLRVKQRVLRAFGLLPRGTNRGLLRARNLHVSERKPRVTPRLSVVLGSYNRRPLLEHAIESVRAFSAKEACEIIVVDGGSTDGSLEWLLAQKDIITVVQHNRGEFRGRAIERRSWGYFMNLGFKSAQADWILMISDDCIVLPGSIEASLKTAAGLSAEGRKIGGIAYYFRNWPSEERYYVQKTTGAKLMVNHGLFSRAALEVVGFCNEDDYAFYKADGDLSLRIWEAGFEIVPCSDAIVEHYLDDNEKVRQSNNAVADRDRATYYSQWGHLRGKPSREELSFVDTTQIASKAFGKIATGG